MFNLIEKIIPRGRRRLAMFMTFLAVFISFTLTAYAQSQGTLDSTFGTGGLVSTNVSTSDDEILAIAVQPDNQIIVVGYSEKPAQFTIARYTAAGVLDTSFGTGGIVKTAFSGAAFARGVAIQSDGKIVVCGEAGQIFALARYTTSGQLDTSFGTSGKVLTPIGSSSGANSLAIQLDGKIVAAGYSEKIGDFAVVRYASDGSLDSTFGGGDGIVTTDFYSDNDRANAIKLQSNGKIVVAGSAVDFDLFNNFAIARYNSDGSLDTGFNSSGKVTTQTDCGANALALQLDGKIVVAGSTGNILVARYTTGGVLDTSFDSDGLVSTDIGGNTDSAAGLAIDPNMGGIILAGTTESAGNQDFAVIKYSSNGALDTTFDNQDGIVTTSFGTNGDTGLAVGIQPNGKLVVGGSKGNFGAKDFAVARYQGFPGPTAALVSISGRIFTSDGTGVRNVSVTLSGMSGVIGSVRTSSFGYYTFEDVPVGETYIIQPISRRYSFAPSALVINLMDEYTGADFTVIE